MCIRDSHNFPPAGRNRGFYSNPRLDALIDQVRRETDQNVRKRLYSEVQEILARDVPSINLWYYDNVLVHTRRVRNVALNPSGNYDFLKTAVIGNQESVVGSQLSVVSSQRHIPLPATGPIPRDTIEVWSDTAEVPGCLRRSTTDY